MVDGAHVRVGEILDVDVVTHAGPVFCWVVVPKDRNVGFSTERRGEDERDQVRLGLVVLAEIARGRGAPAALK